MFQLTISMIFFIFLVASIRGAEFSIPVRRHGVKNHVQAAMVRALKQQPVKRAIEEHNFRELYHTLSNAPLPLSPYDLRRASLSRYNYASMDTINKNQIISNEKEKDMVNDKSRDSKKRLMAISDTSFISCSDIIYYGEISLGTPLQTLQVILDTGSADLWLFSSTCTNCAAGTNKYSHADSSTYIADGTAFSIQYADGDHVSGVLSVDKLTWGGLVAPQQGFAEISDAATFTVSCVEDGLLGMAFDSIASSGQTTPFHSLMIAGEVTNNVFAFYLYDDDSGVLTLGGTSDEHHSTPIQWFSLSTPQYGFWEIALHYAKPIGGVKVASGHTAIMDTGTTLIIGPPSAVASIATDVGAKCYFLHVLLQQLELKACDSGGSFYMALIPCGNGLVSRGGSTPDPPEVSFVFGTSDSAAHTFTLSADDYSLPSSSCPAGYTMDCAGSCIPNDSSALDWIGDGTCDDGTYGYFFNCPAFECDKGDCDSAACDMGDPGEMCYFGIDGGLSAGDTYWIFGDVFLRKVYTAYNYANKKVGLAYASQSTTSSTLSPSSQPIPQPIPQPTFQPVITPTRQPSYHPTLSSLQPSSSPLLAPTSAPSMYPTSAPTPAPTLSPIPLPSVYPTASPTNESSKWPWLDVTLSINANESPTTDALEHIVNALFQVSASLGQVTNMEQYEMIDWSDNTNSVNNFPNKQLLEPKPKKLILPPSLSQLHARSSPENLLHLRGKIEQDRTRRLTGLATIRVRISAGSDIKGVFQTSDAWIAEVASELDIAMSNGSLDDALENECSCGLTIDSQSVELTTPLTATKHPTLSPTKESRRRRDDGDDVDGDDSRRKHDDDDSSAESTAAAAGAAVAVIVVVIGMAAAYIFCYNKDSTVVTWYSFISERVKFNKIFNFVDEEDEGSEENGVELSSVEPPRVPALSRESMSDSIYEAQNEAYGYEKKKSFMEQTTDKDSIPGGAADDDATEGLKVSKPSSVSDLIYSAQMASWSKKTTKKNIKDQVESIESNPLHGGKEDEDSADEDQFHEVRVEDGLHSEEEEEEEEFTRPDNKGSSYTSRIKSPYQVVSGQSGGKYDEDDDEDDEEYEEVPLSFSRTAEL